MERLDGEPLSERLKRGPLGLSEALGLGREMLSALGKLHAQAIVHRDLKPSNVFLTSHGTKLLDFGPARPLTTDSGGPLALESALTRSGLMVGTSRYMAPEQILGDPVDARTDVFAAGAVLFEALAGRPAFPGTKVAESATNTRSSCAADGCRPAHRGAACRTRRSPRSASLPASVSHSTELPMAAQSSQSRGARATVEKARCRKGV